MLSIEAQRLMLGEGRRFRVLWLDRDSDLVETVGKVETVSGVNVLLAPDGWKQGAYQSVGLGRVMGAEEVS